jgi:hypothetical protein
VGWLSSTGLGVRDALTALAVALAVGLAMLGGLLEGLELQARDGEFRLRGRRAPRTPVIIVSIDEDRRAPRYPVAASVLVTEVSGNVRVTVSAAMQG